jgi:hypothetical protein
MKNPGGFLAFSRHFLVACWRHGRGRWYFLRDRPDWFVQQLATLDARAPEYNDITRAILQEAHAENLRRIDQELRKAAAAMPQFAPMIEEVRDTIKQLEQGR